MNKISILTYGSGYTFDIYNRFIGTLNNCGFTGKIYLIIKNIDIDILVKIQEKYNNVVTYLDTMEKTTHINCHRFFVIQEFLNKNYIEDGYIFLCDFKDVLFQKNIELYEYDDSDIYVFLEGIKIIKDKNCNTPWLLELEKILNDTFYETICNNNVICCGTTLGKINAIQKYVYQMCKILLDYKISNNLDQGIHNYLIYLNKLDLKIKLLNNTDNLVNTVGCDVHKLNDDNFITNKNNSISYVVHQYDRFCLDYKQRLSEKFGFNFNI